LITESQNGRGWKGSLRIIESNLPAKAESTRAGCIGLRPVLNTSREGESTTSLGNFDIVNYSKTGIIQLFLVLEFFTTNLYNKIF